jgi:hypothetical protein
MRAVIARTLPMISSAVAVHLMGLQSLFQCLTNDSISRLRFFSGIPRRTRAPSAPVKTPIHHTIPIRPPREVRCDHPLKVPWTEYSTPSIKVKRNMSDYTSKRSCSRHWSRHHQSRADNDRPDTLPMVDRSPEVHIRDLARRGLDE